MDTVTDNQWLLTAALIAVTAVVVVLVVTRDAGWYAGAAAARAYYDPLQERLVAERRAQAEASAALTASLEKLCAGWDELKHLVRALTAAAEADLRRLGLPHSRLDGSTLDPAAAEAVDAYVDQLVAELEARYHPKGGASC